jgi:hypothetical protein
MSELQTSLPATLVSADPTATTGRHAPKSLHTCLVVSVSPERAQLLVRAAHEELWATIVCRSADDALRQSVRHRIHLALIDLQTAPTAQQDAFRALVRQLAGRNSTLLAVCGRPNDAASEIWSRQLGVWMYLPGVNGQSDVALLCSEARQVLTKLEHRSAAGKPA